MTTKKVSDMSDDEVLVAAGPYGPDIIGKELHERAERIRRVNPGGKYGPTITGAATAAENQTANAAATAEKPPRPTLTKAEKAAAKKALAKAPLGTSAAAVLGTATVGDRSVEQAHAEQEVLNTQAGVASAGSTILQKAIEEQRGGEIPPATELPQGTTAADVVDAPAQPLSPEPTPPIEPQGGPTPTPPTVPSAAPPVKPLTAKQKAAAKKKAAAAKAKAKKDAAAKAKKNKAAAAKGK
jgi:colicin import membrane protein